MQSSFRKVCCPCRVDALARAEAPHEVCRDRICGGSVSSGRGLVVAADTKRRLCTIQSLHLPHKVARSGAKQPLRAGCSSPTPCSDKACMERHQPTSRHPQARLVGQAGRLAACPCHVWTERQHRSASDMTARLLYNRCWPCAVADKRGSILRVFFHRRSMLKFGPETRPQRPSQGSLFVC